jgi:hypothetical protein
MGIMETIGTVIAGLFAFLLYIARVRKNATTKGQTEAEETARRLDHENAAAIRDRARDAKRVRINRDDDTRGFRDD